MNKKEKERRACLGRKTAGQRASYRHVNVRVADNEKIELIRVERVENALGKHFAQRPPDRRALTL